MISPEEFKVIYEKAAENEPITAEEVQALIQVIVELDAQSVMLQNALVLTFDNAVTVVEALAEGVLARSGRTETKIKRAVAKMAANAVARLQLSTQLFLSGALEQSEQMVNPSTIEGEISAAGEVADEEEAPTVDTDITEDTE